MWLSTALGLVAALLFAVSASLQQLAARSTAPAPAGGASGGLATALPVVRILRSLVRSRIWLTGWVTNLVGFFTQAAALHLGSVALVQPLLVTQLLFSLPLSSMRTHRRPRPLDWAAGAAICAGIGLFLSERDDEPLAADPDRLRVLLAAGVLAVLVALLLRAGAGRPPAVHAALASVAAGLCFAMSAVLIKLTTEDLLTRGVGATAVDWPGYSLALSTLMGLLIEQEAFAAGALPTAIAGMSITNPVVSYGLAVFAFGDTVPHSAAALATFCLAGVLLAAGVVGLAQSPTVRREVAQAPDLSIPSSAAGEAPRDSGQE